MALQVDGIKKSFGGLEVLTSVSFKVTPGERRAMIGPNGAGKTTLFNMISGDLTPTAGRIYFHGRDITAASTHHRAQIGLGRTFQKNNLFPALTVENHLILALQAAETTIVSWWRRPRRERELRGKALDMLGEWGLHECAQTRVRELSYGEQRQVELLLGVASNPKILLLDEPTAGMSPAETMDMAKRIAELPREMTIIIIEHDMDVVFQLADRVTVLYQGTVLVEGDPLTVQQDPRVLEVYLGEEGVHGSVAAN